MYEIYLEINTFVKSIFLINCFQKQTLQVNGVRGFLASTTTCVNPSC